MKLSLKKIYVLLCLAMLSQWALAGESNVALSNYVPNYKHAVVHVKNVDGIKNKLENHTLKNIFYNDKTKDLFSDLFKDEGAGEENEQKELDKKSFEKFTAAWKGDLIVAIDFTKKISEESTEGAPVVLFQGDQSLFEEFVKAELMSAEKKGKTITKKDAANVEYHIITKEDSSNHTPLVMGFTSGIAIMAAEEDVFIKIATAISNGNPLENSLRSNEGFNAHANQHLDKDVVMYCDLTDLMAKEIEKSKNPNQKKTLEFLKLHELFGFKGFLKIENQTSTFEVAFANKDEGLLSFFTFINKDFNPHPSISEDITSYSKVNFSIKNLKDNIIAFAKKMDDNFDQQYEMIKQQALQMGQIDIESFFNSFGEETDSWLVVNKDQTQESFSLHSLSNKDDFTKNFSALMNNPFLKQATINTVDIKETKEDANIYWSIIPKADDEVLKQMNMSLGVTQNFFFATNPAALAPKLIASISKNADKPLANAGAYQNARSQFPNQLALFSYASTKEIFKVFKNQLNAQKNLLGAGDDKFEKIIEILNEIKEDDVNGYFSTGLWKSPNQLNLSIKINTTK